MLLAGAVLCGGRSTRMGADKALLAVDGVPMALRAASALVGAGCSPVVAVGGDAAALAELGLGVVPDETPGEGPLGGVLAALHALPSAEAVAVVACDMPDLADATVVALASALAAAPAADVAVAVAQNGRLHPMCAVWRRTAAVALEACFAAGERRMQEALSTVRTVQVTVDAQDVANMNTPDDLRSRL